MRRAWLRRGRLGSVLRRRRSGAIVRPLNLIVRPPMSVALIVAVLIATTAVFAWRSNRRRALVIRSPRLGILDLKGEPAEQLIAADMEALMPVLGSLFADMKLGVSMPVAWVKLAPQGPLKEHESLPSTIFACEAGQMVFG